jgi:hypothetical protein
MLDIIQNISSPLIITILLGLAFMLEPCTLLVNISAIGYISNDYKDKRQYLGSILAYMAGRLTALCLLGYLLVILLKSGYEVLLFRNFFDNYGEILLIPLLIILGLALIFADKISWLKIMFSAEKIDNRFKNNNLRAMILGFLLSFTFCPTNIIIFFAVLLPLSISASYGIILPLVFSLSTLLVVAVIALLLIFGLNHINNFYKTAEKISKWFIKITGVIFLLIGLYILIEQILS